MGRIPIASNSISVEGVRLGVVEALVGYHIRRAGNVFLTDFTQSVSGTGMRQVLFGILSIIAANPGISQGKVGEALGIQRNNMAALANELEERGLLQRETVLSNRRTLSLTITAAGRTALDDCLLKIREHEDRLLGKLAPLERATLVELLDRIGSE
jgi:DNA-binding MarR family transcriptional regulator